MQTKKTSHANEKAYAPLVWIGAAMLVFAFANWIWIDGNATNSTITKTTAPPRTEQVQTKTISKNATGNEGVIEEKTVTVTENPPATEMLVTEADPARSDAVMLALIGGGLLSILAGAFRGRVSSLKGPGFELGLSPTAEKKVVEEVATKATTKEQVELVLPIVRARVAEAGTSPGDDYIAFVADSVLAELRTSNWGEVETAPSEGSLEEPRG